MPTETPYTIADLARLTGVSVRTVRYYLAQGLIPSSGESGPGAHYGEGHLQRLRLTKRLQAQHQPLSEIRTQLAAMTDADVAAALQPAAEPPPEAQPSSALEYVRGVLGTGPARRLAAARPMARLSRAYLAEPAADAPRPTAWPSHAAGESPEPAPVERSQWERISLSPNLEMNVRRPLSRLEQKRVERLITIARQVLKEDTP
jgi:DNA-binding transcriptional MerR regulator